ncbi:MAG: hypothetical protein ACI9UA_004361 [Pseudoalteromonas tetraodonis]|jgi:hypothetical protein
MLDRGDVDIARLAERLAAIELDSLAAQYLNSALDICRTDCRIRFAEALLAQKRSGDAV